MKFEPSIHPPPQDRCHDPFGKSTIFVKIQSYWVQFNSEKTIFLCGSNMLHLTAISDKIWALWTNYVWFKIATWHRVIRHTYTDGSGFNCFKCFTYDVVRRVSELRRDLAVSAEDPTPIHTSHSDSLVADSDPLVASSVHRTPAQNSQREGRSLQRNPETRRTPSYIEPMN